MGVAVQNSEQRFSGVPESGARPLLIEAYANAGGRCCFNLVSKKKQAAQGEALSGLVGEVLRGGG